MNAIELRIGNWVHHKAVWSKYNNDSNASEPLTDFDMQIEQACFYHDEECTLSIEHDLEPISLTEEWLKRFGFKGAFFEAGKYYKYGNHRVYIFDDGFEFEYSYGKSERFNLFRKYKYVHQLQNLFHALTGQELNAKEI